MDSSLRLPSLIQIRVHSAAYQDSREAKGAGD